MKTCLGLLLICLVFNSYAQQDVKQKIDSLNKNSFELRIAEKNTAIALAKKAIQLSREVGYEKGLYDSYRNLGINYTNLSRYDSAIILLKLCEEYFDHSFESGLSKYYLGINYSNLRSFNKAIDYFDEALSIFSEMGENEYQAYVYNSLGIIEGRQSNYDKALEYFLKAYDEKLSNGFPYDEELSNISIVYRRMNKLDKALEFSKKSLKMVAEQRDSLGIAQTYVSIGNIFNSMSVADSAIKYYDKSYSIAKKKNYHNHMASAIVNKADVFVTLNKPDSAIALIARVLKLANGDKSIEASANHKLAKIYYANREYRKGLTYAFEAYKLNLANNNLSAKKEVSLLISSYFKKVNEPDSALKYMNLHNGYLQEYFTENYSSNISDLQVKIETLEKDHEISNLTQEKEIEKIKRERLLVISGLVILLAVIIIVWVIKRHQEKNKRQKLEKEKLQIEINKSQEDLYKQTIHMIHVNNCLNEIEEEIKQRNDKNIDLSNMRILNSIKVNKSLDKDWQNFNDYFGNVHINFYDKLSEKATELSNHDMRICALLKLGLSNREISTILNIESKSVSMLKYRIKKKLKLEEELDLGIFVQSL